MPKEEGLARKHGYINMPEEEGSARTTRLPEKEGSARTTRPEECSGSELAMAPLHPKNIKKPKAESRHTSCYS